MWKWCVLEYKHISKIVGKDNLWITNVKKENKELEKHAKVIKESVTQLGLSNACILDPEAEKTLKPQEGFKYYIFGGILGDYPPRKRTQPELTEKMTAEARNIGKEQMPTDSAVLTVKKIVEGTPFKEMKFQDELIIPVKEGEEIIMPYRYALFEGKPLLSKELLEHIKKKGF